MSIPDFESTPTPSRVVTVCRDGRWLNTVPGAGPLPGSFRSQDAAVAVGRAYAAKAGMAHAIADENGAAAGTESDAAGSYAEPSEARETPRGAGPDETGAGTDPATAERVRQHERFESAMAEKGLLQDDHSVQLEPEDVRHEEPAGTEQSAG